MYYVTQAYADYTFPDFTESVAGCGMTWTNSISPANSWITGVSDGGGVSATVGWSSTDESHVGTYTITMTATEALCSSGATATDTYTLEVRSQCWVSTISIDATDSVFSSPALTQDVW